MGVSGTMDESGGLAMRLSTRVRYAVRALTELATQDDGRYVPLRELAEKQAISSKYLEQMATGLKAAGLVESTRGAEGGYRLGRPAEGITVWDVYAALDSSVELTNCEQNPCEGQPSNCVRNQRCAVSGF